MNWERLLMVQSGEAVESTDLFANAIWTGNGTSQVITNNINLSERGGLVWIKSRSATNGDYVFQDTERGSTKFFDLNTTAAEGTNSEFVKSFNTNGFTVGNNGGVGNQVNTFGQTYASWSFAAQSKFMSIVEWSGNATSGRTIAHGLGTTPAFIIVKKKNNTSDFTCYHHAIDQGAGGAAAPQNYSIAWNDHTTYKVADSWLNNTAPDATNFTLNNNKINASGSNYIGYFFAHHSNSGTQVNGKNIISCGYYVGNGSLTGPTIDCQFDSSPRFIMIKALDSAHPVYLIDSERGYSGVGNDPLLKIETNTAETSFNNLVDPTSSGFQLKDNDNGVNQNLAQYIYVAIA